MLVISGIALVGSVLFMVDAGLRLRADQSMDVPLPENRRVGFYGLGGARRWVCGEGHEHLSAPYWVGALGAVGVTGLCFTAYRRLSRRPRA